MSTDEASIIGALAMCAAGNATSATRHQIIRLRDLLNLQTDDVSFRLTKRLNGILAEGPYRPTRLVRS